MHARVILVSLELLCDVEVCDILATPHFRSRRLLDRGTA